MSNMEGSYTETDLGVVYNTDVQVDTIKNWFIGANYKF